MTLNSVDAPLVCALVQRSKVIPYSLDIQDCFIYARGRD